MRSAGIDARNGALGKRSSHRVDLYTSKILPTRARFSKAIVRPIVRPQLFRGLQNVRPARAPTGCPAGLRDKDRRSITEGCFPAIQRSLSHPGNLSGSHESSEPGSLTGRSRG